MQKLPRHEGAVKPEGKFEKRNERSVKGQLQRWSLVVGRWSLVVGRWSLVVGRWSLVNYAD
jgi:hypothetical protein